MDAHSSAGHWMHYFRTAGPRILPLFHHLASMQCPGIPSLPFCNQIIIHLLVIT
jgi:hypothetical protein